MRGYIKEALIFVIILLIPVIILLIPYLCMDPLQVVKKHSYFHYNPIEPNRDFVSTEMFLSNVNNYHYNSFIFGSSRAIAFKVNSWKNYLNANAVPFAYDAAGESLYGIYKKFIFLDKKGVSIDNALLIFCRGFHRIDNHKDHIGIKHPEVSGESWIEFHLVHFKSYLDLKFLLGYYSYILTEEENILTRGIIQKRKVSFDSITNQINIFDLDEELRKNPKKFYELRRNIFYERRGESYEPVAHFKGPHIKMFFEIKEILERNNTNYKIILSPIYDQVKFANEDKEILQKIYGDHLFDFTGKNFITENDTNWYETDHFRPFIADSIMSIIYSPIDSIKNKWR